jgi:hypothetical protein
MSCRIPAVCYLVLCAQALSNAQQPAPNLQSFFEKRLSDKADTPPPSYGALLTVIDAIGKSALTDIQSTLPVLSLALKSKTPNLPVEAAFAFFEIARRPDGGTVLRDSVPELASLMASPDGRLSGFAVTTLRNLTRSIPDTTVPLMMNELRSSSGPNLVKAEIVRVILESSKRNDEQVLRSVEAYLAFDADPKVKASNLHAIAANRVKTPAIARYVLSALDDKNKHVQISAIQTVYVLSADVQDQARPIISKLASDPNLDQEVRSLAQRALQNKLADPYKVPEPPPASKRK